MSRLLLVAALVLSLSISALAVNIDSTASAQRDRLVGVVRVKTTAPTVDAAAVEAKLQQFADLRKIDQTASKVRAMLAKINAFRAKVSAVHANVNTFTAQLDNTLQRLNEVSAQHEREQLIARQQFELNFRAQRPPTVVVEEQAAPRPIVQNFVQRAPQPVIVQQAAPQPIIVKQQAAPAQVIVQQRAPQPIIVKQQRAPQPIIVREAAPQPFIVQQQRAPLYVQYASPARRLVYRSPSVHVALAGISSEFDTLVAQHQLAHEAAALNVQSSIHNLRGVLAQPLHEY